MRSTGKWKIIPFCSKSREEIDGLDGGTYTVLQLKTERGRKRSSTGGGEGGTH